MKTNPNMKTMNECKHCRYHCIYCNPHLKNDSCSAIGYPRSGPSSYFNTSHDIRRGSHRLHINQYNFQHNQIRHEDRIKNEEEKMLQQAINESLKESLNESLKESLIDYDIQQSLQSSKLPVKNPHYSTKGSPGAISNYQAEDSLGTISDNSFYSDPHESEDVVIKSISTKDISCNDTDPINEYVRFLINSSLSSDQNKKIDNSEEMHKLMDVDTITNLDSDLTFSSNEHEHYDFIIGRGRNEPTNYMNLPINPMFLSRNVVFIDCNPDTHADIQQRIEDVDFSYFGICKDQDPLELISVNIIFDWSSFYCGAMQNLTRIITNIGRRCRIFIPLDRPNNTIPKDIMQVLNNDVFTITLTDGIYPLFDWTKEGDNCLGINLLTGKQKNISELVNPDKYILICVKFY